LARIMVIDRLRFRCRPTSARGLAHQPDIGSRLDQS
jgi:hypothetical protein